MCISSFAPPLDSAYSDVPGFSAIVFQLISPPFVNPRVCWLYQSDAVVDVNVETPTPLSLIMKVWFKLFVLLLV